MISLVHALIRKKAEKRLTSFEGFDSRDFDLVEDYCSYQMLWEQADAKENSRSAMGTLRTSWNHRDLTTLPLKPIQTWFVLQEEKAELREKVAYLRLSSVMNGLCTSMKKNSVSQREFATPRLGTLEDTAKTIEINLSLVWCRGRYLHQRNQGRLYQTYNPQYFAASTLEVANVMMTPSDLLCKPAKTTQHLCLHNS